METARGNLDIMGAAAPDSATLASMAAAALHVPQSTVLSVRAAPIEMATPNMTTGGLWRLQGTATLEQGQQRAGTRAADGRGPAAPFSVVAKLIQSPLLWSGISQVPPDMRAEMERRYPWRTEAEVYGSGLAEVMPYGGRLPEIFGILGLDGQRTVIWMEDVQESPDARWTDEVFADAAHWLGRLAGSPAVHSNGIGFSAARDTDRVQYFIESVGAHVLIPSLLRGELWQLPAVAAAARPDVVAGLRAVAGRAGELAEEMLALPQLPAHGDASPQNFLQESGQPGPAHFVVIDWGLSATLCAGFDLSQLLSGLVNDGRLRVAAARRLEPLCVAAYCEGLAQSGTDIQEAVVRRGHALSMALFTGLFTLASPRLEEPDSPELHAFMAERLALADFTLALLT